MCVEDIPFHNVQLFQTVSEVGFRHSRWLVGAVSEAGFRRMFVTLHVNMRNARDTNRAVNGSLVIFLCVPFLELMMQRFGPVLWLFSHRMCNWHTFFKTKRRHPGKGAIWTSLAAKCVTVFDRVYGFWFNLTENFSVVKPCNPSGFMSRQYTEQCNLLSD